MIKPKRQFWCLVVIGLLGTLLIVSHSGCSNQTGKANQLIRQYNKRIEKYNQLDQEASDLMTKVDVTPEAEADFVKNIENLEKIETKVDSQVKELSRASEFLAEAKQLEISDDFKTYIKMEQQANRANQKLSEIAKKLARELIDLYQSLNSGPGLGQEERGQKAKAINDLNHRLNDLKQKVEDLKAEAQAYYGEHNLGGK